MLYYIKKNKIEASATLLNPSMKTRKVHVYFTAETSWKNTLRGKGCWRTKAWTNGDEIRSPFKRLLALRRRRIYFASIRQHIQLVMVICALCARPGPASDGLLSDYRPRSTCRRKSSHYTLLEQLTLPAHSPWAAMSATSRPATEGRFNYLSLVISCIPIL